MEHYIIAKSVLIPLRLTEAASADTDAHKKKIGFRSYKIRISGSETHDSRIYGSETTPLKISNKEMKDIMKIVKYGEDSGVLIKTISETTENEAKEQKDGFVVCFLAI